VDSKIEFQFFLSAAVINSVINSPSFDEFDLKLRERYVPGLELVQASIPTVSLG